MPPILLLHGQHAAALPLVLFLLALATSPLPCVAVPAGARTLLSSSTVSAADRCRYIRASTRFDAECTPDTEMVWPLLITGAGRSGTLFTATLMNRLGIRVSHDNRFDPMRGDKRDEAGPLRDGAVSWVYAFADGEYPAWAGSLNGGRFRRVFQQVRHPLKVIGSRAAAPFGESTREFVARHTELPAWAPTYAGNVLSSLHHWVAWNSFLGKISDYRFRLEDMDIVDICHRAELEGCPEKQMVADAVKALLAVSVNHLEDYYPVTWELLYTLDPAMTIKAKTLACEYGYDCDKLIDTANAAAISANSFGYPLAVCARVQNQGRYLKEWIEMHKQAGVSKFYIYYDESTDGTLQVLLDYRSDDERVRIFAVKDLTHGMDAAAWDHRRDCVTRNPDHARWILFAQADEFTFPKEGLSITAALQQPECAAQETIFVPARLFGPGEHRSRPAGSTIEAFTHWGEPVSEDDRGKGVVIVDVKPCRNEPGPCLPPSSPNAARSACSSLFQTNKYITRSVEEYFENIVSPRLMEASKSDEVTAHAWKELVQRLGFNLVRMESPQEAFDAAIAHVPQLTEEDKASARNAFFKVLVHLQLTGATDTAISKYSDLIKGTPSAAARSVQGVQEAIGDAQRIVASWDAARFVIPGAGPARMRRIVAEDSPCPTDDMAGDNLDDPLITPSNPADVTFRFLHIPKTGGTSLNYLLRAAAPMAGKTFCEVPTRRLTRRHTVDLYSTCDVVSAEFDASHRFQFSEAQTGPVFDFIFLRDPASRVISQYEHHRSQDRFAEEDQWDTTMLRLVSKHQCSQDESRYCGLLRDPDKCLGGGWCGLFRNHETEVTAGSRLYSPQLRESIHSSEERLLCTAKRSLRDTSFVLLTEQYNVSVCLFLHRTGWKSLFDSCCGTGLQGGLGCPELQDKLTANIRDTRAVSKVATSASHNYSLRYTERDDIMKQIMEGNRLDCELYNFGLKRFAAQVHQMERETSITFNISNLPMRSAKCDLYLKGPPPSSS
jgi:hypothetical protein